jgi:hypothetical protein
MIYSLEARDELERILEGAPVSALFFVKLKAAEERIFLYG